MTDAEILLLYQERAQSAVSATETQYGAYCRSIARGLLPSAEDAEECVNDVYLAAWNSIPPQRPQKLSAYLGKITRNLALDRLRKAGAEKRGGGQVNLVLEELEDCLSAPSGPEQALEAQEMARALETFLQTLSPDKRRIFLQRYWYLYPIRDIAAAHQVSEAKIASLLFRLRKALKAHFEQEGILE